MTEDTFSSFFSPFYQSNYPKLTKKKREKRREKKEEKKEKERKERRERKEKRGKEEKRKNLNFVCGQRFVKEFLCDLSSCFNSLFSE